MRRLIFTVSITCISRALAVRDLLLGRIGPFRNERFRLEPGLNGQGRFGSTLEAVVTRCAIPSGGNMLDAFLAAPAERPAQAAVLICHGIGETVEHWLPVQRLLAANGAASLVFDYSGYGRSTGRLDHAQCEEDAIAAFEYLQRKTPKAPVSVLGFSLGSGVAAAMITRVAAHRLILCAAFTSLRAAAHSMGIPKKLASALPHIWRAEEALRGYSRPVLIVHGTRDRLFPVRMAEELAVYCAADSELRVIHDLGHNQPFYEPHLSYWGPILTHLARQEDLKAFSEDEYQVCSGEGILKT
jgi:pimeloyl-ACP methyl ester carboxylesterase